MADGKPWFYTLRKHKKKSIAGFIFAGWLANYGINKYREYLIRRELCHAAKAYGDATLPSLKKPRRLMVFFNSSSGKSGEAGDLFKKNAEPILYLAGLDVTTVKTDYEGQIKTLMQYIDPSIDGIVIAGGDGTVLEVVTGLLRRSDQVEVSKIPVGIIPLGDHNSLFRRLFPASSLSQARKIGSAAMAIVKGETQSVDVMEIKGDKGRPTFAMSSIHWGAFRDAISSQDKYWWTGRFRRTMSHIMLAVQEWPPLVQATLSHPAVDVSSFQTSQTREDGISTSLSTRLKSQALTSASCEAHKDDNNLSQQPCLGEVISVDGWTHMPVKSFGMTVELSSPEPLSTEVAGHLLQIKTWPSDFTQTEFIKKGWQLEKMEKNPSSKVDETELKTMAVKEFRLEPADNKVSWFTIDGEPYPAQPITVTLLPNKLKFFWNPAG